MNQTLTIRLSEDLRRSLEAISKAERKPISDLVRDSIRRYITTQRFRQLRNATLPLAEAQGILTDEDVFELIS